MKKRLGPLFYLPDIIRVSAHLFADNQEWQGDRKLLNPLALALINKIIDELIRQIANFILQRLDLFGPKCIVEHRSHRSVVGIITAV